MQTGNEDPGYEGENCKAEIPLDIHVIAQQLSRRNCRMTGIYEARFELPTSGSASHCHYHLTMKAMDAGALILSLIISSSPQAPLT